MLDLKLIRSNPEKMIQVLETRGVDKESVVTLLSLDEKRRALLPVVEQLKQKRNELSDQTAELKKNKQSIDQNIIDNKKVNAEIKDKESILKEIDSKLYEIAVSLPNVPGEGVPVGEDEEENIEIHRWNEQTKFNFTPKPHWEVGENLGILDFERGAKVTGSRFLFYKGLGARLERAVYNFMLDVHVNDHGYTEMVTPYLVNSQSMFGTGQFPKFKEDVFQVQNSDYTLIPTSEVPLTNYHSNEILKEADLPMYYTALSPCFRSEAGSAGRDTRGLIRLHQFHKVEMVKFSTQEDSYEELRKLTKNGEDILERLNLPYRTIVLCTGDMGFSAAMTNDIEVWMPAQDTYREISSCSNCESFQARRAKIRYKTADGVTKFAHTLNGSGLAVGRTVAAILENYQNADGSVTIPEALVSYMGGVTVIK
ncbi:serine--tRNA ligase [Vagococcus sp.]|uniref:serine--tRNA ligase n=1 Tax=Vagococcus sp. TaxID=1933889 RepID=UPI003F9B8C4E